MNWIILALLVTAQAPAKTPPASFAENYMMGGAESPVKIELYSDFQCPACRAFYLDTVTRLTSEYSAGNKVALVFCEFPLPAHPVSRIAARYALASTCLGRDQWLKVVEYLYTCQAEWSYDGKVDQVLSRILAPQDLDKVKEKIKDPGIEQAINHDVEMGNKRQVSSTPTFFFTVGGKEQRVATPLAFPVLKDFIDRSLK